MVELALRGVHRVNIRHYLGFFQILFHPDLYNRCATPDFRTKLIFNRLDEFTLPLMVKNDI